MIDSDTQTNLFDDTWTTVVRLHQWSGESLPGQVPEATERVYLSISCKTDSYGNASAEAEIRWPAEIKKQSQDLSAMTVRFDKKPAQVVFWSWGLMYLDSGRQVFTSDATSLVKELLLTNQFAAQATVGGDRLRDGFGSPIVAVWDVRRLNVAVGRLNELNKNFCGW